MQSGEPAVQGLFEKLVSGDRVALGRAITLMESRRPGDFKAKRQLLERCAERPTDALRIGISGLPGAGKSTFIERFGIELIKRNHRVAVLAVDPSSDRSGGSILGDKTRMDALASTDQAFIRPSPNSGVLGGVTEMTRETIILCETAGYDIVLIETVGVGQAEYGVHGMVDFFLLLLIPGAGDVLQGIKRGIMEMADMVVVNKADGEQIPAAERAAADLRSALSLTSSDDGPARVSVVTASALTGEGIDRIWEQIENRLDSARSSGLLGIRRDEQQIRWFDNATEVLLRSRIQSEEQLRHLQKTLRDEVAAGAIHPLAAAARMVDAIRGGKPAG